MKKLIALTLAASPLIAQDDIRTENVFFHPTDFHVHTPTFDEYKEAFETPAETFGRKMDESWAQRERERERENDQKQGDYDGAGCSCNQ